MLIDIATSKPFRTSWVGLSIVTLKKSREMEMINKRLHFIGILVVLAISMAGLTDTLVASAHSGRGEPVSIFLK